MKRILFTALTILFAAGITFAQKEDKEPTQREGSLNQELQEVIKDVERTLRDIEIPEVNVDEIMEEVREAMPTRAEMDEYKEIVADAVGELKNIDLSELEEALHELRIELGEIFSDHEWNDRDRRQSKKEDEN